MERRIIQIHIPKTGGTTLEKAIWPGSKTVHREASKYPVRQWESFFTFAFVRNPFERSASQYAFHCMSSYDGRLATRFPQIKSFSFHDYLRFASDHRDLAHFYSQSRYCTHSDSDAPLDFLGRFENYAKDAARLLEQLGIEPELRHLKRGILSDYSSLLDKAAQDMIRELYAEDLEAFGYDSRTYTRGSDEGQALGPNIRV